MPSKQKILGTGLESRVVQRAKSKGLNAKKQPLSGVMKAHPSDAVVEQTLIECKVRSAEIDAQGHRIVRVDIDWLLGVEEKAEKAGFEHAALVVNVKGSPKPHALIDLDFFLDLLKTQESVNGLSRYAERVRQAIFDEYRIPPEELQDMLELRVMPD